MSPTKQSYKDFASVPSAGSNSTLLECGWAKKLMNQPIGNFRVLAVDCGNTKTNMNFLLSGENGISSIWGKGKSKALVPCGNTIQ